MDDGFSYNGRHSSEFGVRFIPKPDMRWFSSPAFNVTEKNIAGRDGGYYYSSDAKIRTMKQECYFEEVNMETVEAIHVWLDKDTEGKQIFDERPFVYYEARPSKVADGKLYSCGDELYSGTMSITFSCYEPYGFMTKKAQEEDDLSKAAQYSGMIYETEMPSAPQPDGRAFQMYNCGTRPCNTLIQIGGTGTNIEIANNTNGTKCVLNTLPDTGYLEIDSRLGSVEWVHDGAHDFLFEAHDEGYLTLAPYLPRLFHVQAKGETGSNEIAFFNFKPDESIVGKYIWLQNGWHKILEIADENKAVIDSEMQNTRSEETKIVTMNEITVSGTNLQQTKLAIDYTPMIR